MNKLKERLFIPFLLAMAMLILLTAGLLTHTYLAAHDNDQPSFGVSFSQKYASDLGLDWKEAYKATVQNLGINKIRLMSYWDKHEAHRGQYNFKDLDWMFDQAHKNQVRVSLSIGLRQPRWPECHMPEWAKPLETSERNQALLNYLGKVVKRYRGHQSLASWQLENEASNNLFGECPARQAKFYRQEFELVRSLDASHPLISTASNQIGIPLEPPIGDQVGFSIYNHATPRIFNRNFYWSYWYVPAQWHSLRAAMVEALHDTSVFVHELQTEPWGRLSTPQLSRAQQDELMNPQKLRRAVGYTLDTGIKEIYLWGAEWWYWRQTKLSDPSLWQTAQSIFRGN